MKIYTKTGDEGETSLFDGTRVRKTDPRVVAYGDGDEVAGGGGFAAAAGRDDELREMTVAIQRDLFALGARLADPAHRIAPRVSKIVINDESIARLEAWIDRLEEGLPPLRHFILAGGRPPRRARDAVARPRRRRTARARLSQSPFGSVVCDGEGRQSARGCS